MKLWLRSLLLASCWQLSGAATASSELKAATLMLAVDQAPVCASFLTVMQQRYASKLPFRDRQQLQPAVTEDIRLEPMQSPRPVLTFQQDISDPAWQWLQWTPLLQRAAFFNGALGFSDQNTLLMSPQAPAEVADRLLLRINMLGWRGPFAEYFLLPPEQEQVLLQPELIEDELNAFLQPYRLAVENQPAGLLASPNNLFLFQQHLYYLGSEQTVWRLWPQPQQVCKIAQTKLPDLPAVRALHLVVMDTYVTAGENQHHGSMGFRPPIGDGVWYQLLTRPWLLKPITANCQDSACIGTTAVAQWLQYFGAADAWSQREANALRELMLLAAPALSNFYRQQFRLSAEVAAQLAARALQNYLYQASGNKNLPPELAVSPCGEDGEANNIAPPCAWQADYPLDQLDKLPPAALQQLLTTKNWYGKTALMWAAHFNDYDAIVQLLAFNTQLNDQTSVQSQWQQLQQDQRSALMYAAENGSAATIALLLKAGADATAKDSAGHDLAFYLNKNRSLQLSGLGDSSLAQLQQHKAPAATFSCTDVKRAHEQQLCASAGLRIYDTELTLRYQALQHTAIAPDLKQQQRQWLKNLWTACKRTDNTEQLSCYKTQYRARIRMLDMLLSQLQPQLGADARAIAY